MNEKRVAPRCDNCKRMFAVHENDGTGLCPKCRNEASISDKSIEVDNTDSVDRCKIVAHLSESEEHEKRKEQEAIEPGRFGVTNKQLLPALKKAIAADDLNRVLWLRSAHLYTFEKSLRYLSKNEQAFIAKNIQ